GIRAKLVTGVQTCALPIYQNGDGIPDLIDRAPPVLVSAAATSWDSVITLAFDEQVTAASASAVSHYTVFQTGNPGAALTVRSARSEERRVGKEGGDRVCAR